MKKLRKSLDDSFQRVRTGTGSGGDVVASRAAAGGMIAFGTAVAGLTWVEGQAWMGLEDNSHEYYTGIVIFLVTSLPVAFAYLRKKME